MLSLFPGPIVNAYHSKFFVIGDLYPSFQVSKDRIVAHRHAKSPQESFCRSSSQTTTNQVNDALHALRSLTVRRSYCRDPFRENLPFAVAISAAPAADAQSHFDRESLDGKIF
jgi:hypothetical protein